MSRIRSDMNDFIEIDIFFTDMYLREYSDVLLYPANHVPIQWTDSEGDSSFEYIADPVKCLIDENQALRKSLFEAFIFKSGYNYNSENILRYKVDGNWRKI